MEILGCSGPPLDAAAPPGAPMEQDEPDVVELQDSDEGDVVRRVFIGEGGTQKVCVGELGFPR